jgi:uncharacterized membrane protein
MRIISFLILSLLLIACNHSAKTKEDIKDTATVPVQMPETIIIPDTVFTGFGTEPFWSVYVVINSKIVFHPAEGPDVEVPYPAAGPSVVGDTTHYISSASPAIDLLIVKKNCSDGMSEIIHPYSVTLSVNKTTYAGCGRMGK